MEVDTSATKMAPEGEASAYLPTGSHRNVPFPRPVHGLVFKVLDKGLGLLNSALVTRNVAIYSCRHLCFRERGE